MRLKASAAVVLLYKSFWILVSDQKMSPGENPKAFTQKDPLHVFDSSLFVTSQLYGTLSTV
jgi:hypothetical protein